MLTDRLCNILFLLWLTIVSVGSMLSQVVLVEQSFLHRLNSVSRLHLAVPCHHGHFLKYHSIVRRIHWISTPSERAVAANKHCRHIVRNYVLESLDNDRADLLFVLAFDFNVSHAAGTGDLTIKVIALCRAICRDAHTQLCKYCGPSAVSMYHTIDVRECFIQFQV